MDILINALIRWNKDKEHLKIERVLWLRNEWAYVIDIDSNCMPFLRNVIDIETDIVDGDAEIINEDPYMVISNEDDIQEKYKEIRDKCWQVIKDLVEDKPRIFESAYRRKLIKEAAEKHGVSENSIAGYLKRYWKRGQTPNGLLPDYSLCGGKGKQKSSSDIKRGRPRKYVDVIGEGINVTEDIKRIFRIAVNRFYYTSAKNSLVLTYELMRKEYFAQNYKIENGVKIPIIEGQAAVPSFGQFRYWFNRDRDIKKEITRRYSNKKFQKEYRAITGSAMNGVMQPGTYEIDCQIADCYIVSRFNRNWIIGRPAIYALIDRFSRLICGVYVGLESGSYTGAMMALLNATMDKVEFCKQYGIEITEDEWPVHHLPDAIVADRGELEGSNIENLVNMLNVKVHNTPSYRADLKAAIERFFGLTNERTKPYMPGVVNLDGRERGDKDYRISAKLDLYQFTQIIVKSILYHNNYYYLDNYKREQAMIEDDVPCIPVHLFKWGIANKGGALRSVPGDVVKLALMPVDTAVVTPKGIKYKDMYYASEQMLKGQDFMKARTYGTWRVKISYDSRNMEYIYVHKDNPNSYEKCFLLDSDSRYKDRTLEEIEYLLEIEKIVQRKNKDSVIQAKVQLITEIEDIVGKAEEDLKKEVETVESDTQRVKNIRINRQIEKTANRVKEAFELGTNKDIKEDTLEERIDNETEYDNFDILLQKQKEVLKQ